MKKLIIIIFLFLASPVLAAHQYLEKDYQAVWCEKMGGLQEYELDDRTRVDCLTTEYAIEAEFAPKKFEAIGQALYYAAKTHRKPGILLIIENPDEQRHLDRLNVVAEKIGIKVWTIRPDELRK
jgi:hypothetical protein